ncbi:MAG: hypothetical protein ABSB56_09365, partial [Nitrososphaerales archaeon]
TGPLPPQPTEAASPVEEAGTIRHETGAGSPRPSVVGGCHPVDGPLKTLLQSQLLAVAKK